MIRDVVTVREDITVEEAIEILFKKHIGSIVIIDDEGKPKGIFTERDAIRIVAQKTPLETSLKEVMTQNVVTIWEGASFSEARRCVISHGIRHLPVTDLKGKIVGMLAIRGFLDELFGIQSLKS